MQVPPIEGVSKVIDVFGYFPTFHDGEVIDLHLSRNSDLTNDYPTTSVSFTVHGWEMTSEVTPEGFYRLVKHHLVKFRFDHIDRVNLRDFNHQNVISELLIEKIANPTDHALISVNFDGCYGIEGGFRAVSGVVVEVIPCTKKWQPIQIQVEQGADGDAEEAV
jgi:hypothetical protein